MQNKYLKKMEKMHKCDHMHGILFENVHEDA